MNLLTKRESGQAFILVLVLLLLGSLLITPLLRVVSTGLKAGRVYEEKTDELYAADAGVEYALWNIINDPSLDYLEYNDPYPYTLPQEVNGLPVNVDVTKLSLIAGLDDYYLSPSGHGEWGEFEIPPVQVTRHEDWVEYSCDITFTYTGAGNRTLVAVGTFFAPFPGDRNLIGEPYEIVYTPLMTSAGLEVGSPETKIASGGFSFIWRWEDGPVFSTSDTGAVSFKFKIDDPDWSDSAFFVWATIQQPDVSYVTNAPGLYKWLIEAKAGDTTVRSVVIEDTGALSILTWEIDPPE